MRHLTHWDDVEPRRREAGHLAGTWRDLGSAVGSRQGRRPARRGRPGPLVDAGPRRGLAGRRSSTSSAARGSPGRTATVYEIGADDFLVHLPHREAHTLRAGPDGLSYLTYGHRVSHGNTVLPRAGVAWMYPGYVGVTTVGEGRHPYGHEAEAGEPAVGEPAPRPASIANVRDVEPYVDEHGDSLINDRDLGGAVGSVRTGISHVTIPAGHLGYPPHCHSAEEEIFVVLDGEGTLLLGDDEHEVRPGTVVARPPGSRVAHAFRAGEADLVSSRTGRGSRTTSPTTPARAR